MIYRIPVSWKVEATMEVEADSLEEAVDLAYDTDLPRGYYVDDSFEIDYSSLKKEYPDD